MIRIDIDLAELNIPVFADGDAPQELPNEYYTFSEDSTSNNLSANNEPLEILYEFSLKYYTNNAETLYTGLLNALNLLKAKGYIINGVGYSNTTYRDVWFSRQADIKKIEYINMEEMSNETI